MGVVPMTLPMDRTTLTASHLRYKIQLNKPESQ